MRKKLNKTVLISSNHHYQRSILWTTFLQKLKKSRDLRLIFVPLGAALAVTAVLLPIMLRQAAPAKAPVDNSSVIHSNDNGSNTSSNKHGKKTTYNFNFENYKPNLNSLNEVAYFSYFAFQQENANANGLAQSFNNIKKSKKNNIDFTAETPERDDFYDEFGRLHYPIPYDMNFVFSDFLYFEFDSVNSQFLEERIGNGHIYGVAIKTNIFNDESLLILKKGAYFYSCVTNGGGTHRLGGPGYMEFSAHKTIEGFDLVKDATNKRLLTLNFGPMVNNDYDYESLANINVEGKEFAINGESVFYDPTEVSCSMNELKQLLGDDPNFEIYDGYGGPDALVYDAANSEQNTFSLDEFEGTFRVSEDKLYLNDEELTNLYGAEKIYASEINKDAHRDLVFESVQDTYRHFNVFDVKRTKYLYHKALANIGEYDYYIGMRDGRVVVDLYKPGLIGEEYVLDYGYFAYGPHNGATIVWQNLYQLSYFKLSGVYENDGETPVEIADKHYSFKVDTPYIIEMELAKFSGTTNNNYPSTEYQVECKPNVNVVGMPNQSPEWTFLSMENGMYRYQITFHQKGYSYYTMWFYYFNFEFKAVVSE